MKALLLMLPILMTLSVFAFKSDQWLAQREQVTKTAMSLREAYRACEQQIDSPAEGVVIPLDTFPDGSVKLRATAKKAQFFVKSGMVWIEDVVIVKFDDERNEVSRIEASKCVFDRNRKQGWVEGHAKFIHGKTTMEGDDVYFDSEAGYITSFKNSRIVSTDMKFGGAL